MASHVPRVFCEQPLSIGTPIRLPGDTAHHLVNVLRLAHGAELVLFDGGGGEFLARVRASGKSWLEVEPVSHRDACRESPLVITLVQGISRGERMDYTIQKAVELGVTAIQPVNTARAAVKLDAERAARKLRHWQEIARCAAEQSGRDRVPKIADILPLSTWIGMRDRSSLGLVLEPEAKSVLRDINKPQRVDLLIGAEGGLAGGSGTCAGDRLDRRTAGSTHPPD